jgi:hypothetical protein
LISDTTTTTTLGNRAMLLLFFYLFLGILGRMVGWIKIQPMMDKKPLCQSNIQLVFLNLQHALIF